jgi:hypothetical protein
VIVWSRSNLIRICSGSTALLGIDPGLVVIFTAAVDTVMCFPCGVAGNLQDVSGKSDFMVTVGHDTS